jgi:hypothetical protein
MYFDLFIASLLFALGAMIFGRFEDGIVATFILLLNCQSADVLKNVK